MWRWIVVAVLLAHGAAHIVGVMGALFGKVMDDISGQPTVTVGSLERPIAVLWLVALLGFVAAAIGLAANQTWCLPAAWASVVVSMVPVTVWWNDAWRGAVLNAIVVGVLLYASKIPGLPVD